LSQPNCEVCPLRGSKIVPPNGFLEAEIAIVGEGPGEQEEVRGRGFIGKSGRLLDLLLERAGIDRSKVFVSNAALCRPRPITLQRPDGALTYLTVEDVKLLSVKSCRPRLLEELLKIRPKVIIPIGALAMQSIIGVTDGILGRRGAVHLPLIEEELQKARNDLIPQAPRPTKVPKVKKEKKPKKIKKPSAEQDPS
jgi:DNA polymerase